MNMTRWSQVGIIVLCVWVTSQSVAQQPPNSPAALDTAKIEQLTGGKGKLDEAESVFKKSHRIPRQNRSSKNMQWLTRDIQNRPHCLSVLDPEAQFLYTL